MERCFEICAGWNFWAFPPPAEVALVVGFDLPAERVMQLTLAGKAAADDYEDALGGDFLNQSSIQANHYIHVRNKITSP
jgi:hypothetical protein